MTTVPTGVYLRESDAALSRPDRYGLPEQLRMATAVLTERPELKLIKEYVDEEADSAELDRPALDELREDMTAGHIKVLIFPRVDRMARDIPVGNTIYAEARQYGVEVIFAAPDERTIDDTPEGQVMLTLKLYAAAKYRQALRQQTQNARHARARSGKPIPGHHVLFGYAWADEKKSRTVIDEVKAEIVREIFRRVADGEPIQRVAKVLSDRHTPSPGGKARKWWPQHIVRLLKRREYIGEAVAYRTVTTKARRKLGNGKMKTVDYTTVRPLDDPKRVTLEKGKVYPPIVDDELFERAQARLERNRVESRRRNPEPEATLLRSGFAVCGYCGKPLSAVRQPKATAPGKETWDYACRRKECPSRGVASRAEVLDAEVWQTTVRMATNAEWLWEQAQAWQRAQQQQRDTSERTIRPLEKRVLELERKQGNLRAAIADAATPEVRALLTHDLNELVTEQKQVAQWLEEAKARADYHLDRAEGVIKMAKWVRQRRMDIVNNRLTYQEKRDLLSTIDTRVILWRQDHTPRWTAVYGWTTFLFDRAEHPGVIPLPVGPMPRQPEVPMEQYQIGEEDGKPVLSTQRQRELEGEATFLNEAAFGAIALESLGWGTASAETRAALITQMLDEARGPIREEMEATLARVPDPEQFARDLEPAVVWATQWLTRPRRGLKSGETHNQ